MQSTSADQTQLQVRDLRVDFRTEHGLVKAVNGVSFDLNQGRTLGVVGESGCGKSISMLALLHLIQCPPGRISGGSAIFEGSDLLKLTTEEMRSIRGRKIGMIFQDPMTSLNPVFSIGDQIMEAITSHYPRTSRQALKQRTMELLDMVGIPQPARVMEDYPHQFSGGMRQRVIIAIALACQPSLLIADEPTTALDVTVQEQLLELLGRLQKQFAMSMIWITHDLGVVAGVADRINVMYAGRIVETSSVQEIFEHPCHPYTVGLLESIPKLEGKPGSILRTIPGSPPDMARLPMGCAFAPRCSYKEPHCQSEIPSLEPVGSDHLIACWVKPELRLSHPRSAGNSQ